MKLEEFANDLADKANLTLGGPEGAPWEVTSQRPIRGNKFAPTAQAHFKIVAFKANRASAKQSDRAIAKSMETAIKNSGGKPYKFKDPETGVPSSGYKIRDVFVEKIQDFAYAVYTWKKAAIAFKLGESVKQSELKHMKKSELRQMIREELQRNMLSETVTMRNVWLILNPQRNMSIRTNIVSAVMAALKPFDIKEVPTSRNGVIPSWVQQKIEHRASRVFALPDLTGEESEAFSTAFEALSSKIRSRDISIHLMHR